MPPRARHDVLEIRLSDLADTELMLELLIRSSWPAHPARHLCSMSLSFSTSSLPSLPFARRAALPPAEYTHPERFLLSRMLFKLLGPRAASHILLDQEAQLPPFVTRIHGMDTLLNFCRRMKVAAASGDSSDKELLVAAVEFAVEALIYRADKTRISIHKVRGAHMALMHTQMLGFLNVHSNLGAMA